MSSSDQNWELVIVMPAFNEEASISKVFSEWSAEVSRWTDSFHFLIIDDGSTDQTGYILRKIAAQSGSRVTIIDQKNAGHGQTCFQGYAWAVRYCARYVLQIDSDGQCDPRFFEHFWLKRGDYDVIYGKRTKRDDGLFRVAASGVMKLCVFAVSQTWCVDANVPYRLIRTSVLPRFLGKIPQDFNLANVALAVLFKRDAKIRHGYVKIQFRKRHAGIPSVPFARFLGRGYQLIRQLRTLR